MAAKPVEVKLFTYRVGFGDCFLLRFSYAKGPPKHVLVDFGSTARAVADTKVDAPMVRVAEDIAAKCTADGGSLVAIVATHRHRDHISGFSGASWKPIAKLKPQLVLLPWTEHPDAKVDATAAPSSRRGKLALGEDSRLHAGTLQAMHATASAIVAEAQRKGTREAPKPADKVKAAAERPDPEDSARPDVEGEAENALVPAAETSSDELVLGLHQFGKSTTRQLEFIGDDNLANEEALRNLSTIAPCDYLSFGATTRLKKLLPGVNVDVLGPPTLEQTRGIMRQASKSKSEFWLAASAAAQQSVGGKRLFPRAKVLKGEKNLPLETRWFITKMNAVRGDQLLQLVRILDDAMNNTSLILLFTVAGKKLLFPGDAQLENWMYALEHEKVRAKLADVDVYKVGHHGSTNATPKTLWALLQKKGRGLKTFMSTRKGKHGSPRSGTEVPRSTLVDALETESQLFSTLSLTRRDEFVNETVIVP